MNKVYNYCGNTRDLGIYKTKDGKDIQINKLIRSNLPDKENEDFIQFLTQNKINTIIDLRTEKEYEDRGSIFEKNKLFKIHHLELSNGSKIPSKREDVPRSYISMLEEKDMIYKFRRGSVANCLWKYIGEVIFNMLVLVGIIKASDRIAKEMMGL